MSQTTPDTAARWCAACKGTGENRGNRCGVCNGTGSVPDVVARWAVVDVPNDPRRRETRVTATFRTWIGAHWMRRRWVRRHKREHCWPECSTLWHYEVRRAR